MSSSSVGTTTTGIRLSGRDICGTARILDQIKGHSEPFEPFRNPRPAAHGIFTNPSGEDETIEILQGGGQRLQGPFINHVIPIFQSALAYDIEEETALPDINQVFESGCKRGQTAHRLR